MAFDGKEIRVRDSATAETTATAEICPLAQMKLLYVSSETVSKHHGWNQRSP
jgi:hypothetical protein